MKLKLLVRRLYVSKQQQQRKQTGESQQSKSRNTLECYNVEIKIQSV